jgi:hypothetical protein
MSEKSKTHYVYCIANGRKFRLGNGHPMTEKEANSFRRAFVGGIGERVGQKYVVESVNH